MARDSESEREELERALRLSLEERSREDEEVSLAIQLSLQGAAEQQEKELLREKLQQADRLALEQESDTDQIIPECPACLYRLKPPLQVSHLHIIQSGTVQHLYLYL